MKIFITLMMTLTCSGYAFADSSRLGLKEAINMAISGNNQVRAAGFTAEAARQGAAAVASRYYPSVSFEESFNASNSPTRTFMMKLDEGRFTQNDFLIGNLNSPGTGHDFRTALTAKMPLYDPATRPMRTIAVKESEIQDTRHDQSKQETAFRVFRQYLDIQRAQSRLHAAEQAVADAREHLRLAGVRSRAGVGLRSDELRARTHIAGSEQQLISARNNLTIARLELASTIGLKEGESADVDDAVIAAVPLTLSVDDLTAAAIANRIELKLSQGEFEKADATLQLARSSYLPSLNAFASYQMNSRDTPFGSDNDAWNAGAALSWQIFDGFKRCRERDKASAEKSAATEMREHARRETGLRVR
ncbi:MAG TPA: TolC family protein, partial [Desulfuromonadales bacterium]|nr:TolC family protein [Desulfuromonadales bacterium]